MLSVRVAAGAVAIAIVTSGLAPRARAPDTDDDIRAAVQGQIELNALYQPGGYAALWTDRGSLSGSARDALRLLAGADSDGLDPADYDVDRLRASAAALAVPRDRSDHQVAQFDLALSRGMLRYLHDLHVGRVDPRALGFQLEIPPHRTDVAASLRKAITDRQIVETARSWTPRGPQYPALVNALARYRGLAHHESAPLPPVAKSVHPNEHYVELAALLDRLVLLGDLDGPTDLTASNVYRGSIVDAVRHFQRRHGIAADGVLGRATIAQLNVPIASRVRQLALALERLRWLPQDGNERLVVVNIPVFRLFAWDTIPPAGAPEFSSQVIVGRAVKTQTPVFTARLTEILFRPYWNVPTSILRKEILPTLARQPGYLEREQLEVVDGQSDAAPVVAATPDALERLRDGQLRLRQRPGPKNSLGLIKFSLPNENDVYMHATPARALFARTRRDFSHGCVRVEDPVGLAEWVLADQPGWDRGRITDAMNGSSSSRVSVRKPVRVMMVYSTAAVDLATGDVLFADDIYREDERLERALQTASAVSRPSRSRRSARFGSPALPAPDATGVDVDEIGGGVVAHTAASN